MSRSHQKLSQKKSPQQIPLTSHLNKSTSAIRGELAKIDPAVTKVDDKTTILKKLLPEVANKLNCYSPFARNAFYFASILNRLITEYRVEMDYIFMLSQTADFSNIDMVIRDNLLRFKKEYNTAVIFIESLKTNELNALLQFKNSDKFILYAAYFFILSYEERAKILKTLDTNVRQHLNRALKNVQLFNNKNNKSTATSSYFSNMLPLVIAQINIFNQSQASASASSSSDFITAIQPNSKTDGLFDDLFTEYKADDETSLQHSTRVTSDTLNTSSSSREASKSQPAQNRDVHESALPGSSQMTAPVSSSAHSSAATAAFSDAFNESTQAAASLLLTETQERYSKAKENLEQALKHATCMQNPKVKMGFEAVAKKIKQYGTTPEFYDDHKDALQEVPFKLQETIIAMENTTKVLNGDMSVQEYHDYAHGEVTGNHGSYSGKMMSAVMIVAAAALAALSVLTFAGTLGGGAVVSLAFAASSTLLLAQSCTLFSKSSATGMHAAVAIGNDVEKALKEVKLSRA